MRVLGLDPGTIAMGYGVLDLIHDEIKVVDFGTFKTRRADSRAKRLLSIHSNLIKLLPKWNPDEICVEDPFVGKNVKSALAIAEARGIGLISAAAFDIPIHQYTPTKIKMAVTGYGRSNKDQIRTMVSIQLRLNEQPTSHDASDALGVALCHINQVRQNELLSALNQ